MKNRSKKRIGMRKRLVLTKTKVCPQGKIVYRLPCSSEVFSLLAEMQIKQEMFKPGKDLDITYSMMMMGKMLDSLDPFITEVEVEYDGEKRTDVEFVLSHPVFITPLTEIATDFISLLQGEGAKKNAMATL